jgi:hypothetical protein
MKRAHIKYLYFNPVRGCNSYNNHIEFVAEEHDMLIDIQFEILKTLQMQKCALVHVQKEMLHTLKESMKCCRPLKDKKKGIIGKLWKK